jgi:hypothetical protein
MKKDEKSLAIRDSLMEMFTELSENIEVSSRDLLKDMKKILQPEYLGYLSAALDEAGHWNREGENE